jgi:hypothetical protein
MKEEDRKNSDLEKLKPLIKEIEFFKRRKELKEEDFTEICQCLKFEEMEKGDLVCEIGSF